MEQQDPFRVLDEDIYPYILKHLDSLDIKRSSVVSHRWCRVFGNSRQCMKRFVCRINDPQSQLKLLERTLRMYENFRITAYGFYSEFAEVMKNFPVKKMWITDISDKDVEHEIYVNFMTSFASTVEYLQTGDVFTKNGSRMVKIDFPSLQKLHCTFTNRSAFSIFLGENPKLEAVILSSELNAYDDELLGHDNVIIEFLSKNQQIKDLCLLHLEKIFRYDISSKVTHKLRNFTFTTNFQALPKHVKENFLKFFNKQKCLDAINVMGCRDKSILTEIWNEGVRFRKIFMIDSNFYEDLHMHELEKNFFIEDIDFYLTSSYHVYIFLHSTPNIVRFKVRQLCKQLIEYSVQNLKCLEEIKFQSVDGDALKYYNDLKQSSGSVVQGRTFFELKELDFFDYLNIDKN